MKKVDGFAYIALLVFLSVLMLLLTAASETVEQNAKREKEKQLFFVGEQFRNAIASYYENTPQGEKQFPKKLEDLLKDKRAVNTLRHLRRIYRDPITNNFSWGEIRNEKQRIIGVFSLSSEKVIMTHFSHELVNIDKEKANLRYSDLQFSYRPKK